jgi:AcrR family transcriptional regulator
VADPERSTELLWGSRTRRGLTLEAIVRTAISLADAEGLAAVSMRRVAERLGFTTMSLYRHVPGKTELVELMRDAVLARDGQDSEVVTPGDQAAAGRERAEPPDPAARSDGGPRPGWRDEIAAWARDGLALYQRHPWLLDSTGSRTVPGPNAVAGFERALATVRRSGLAPSQIVAVVTLVGGFVESAARQVVEVARAEQRSGVGHEEWWGARDSLFGHLDRYPTLSWIYEQGGFDQPLDPFEFGLERVLDGVATLIRDDLRDESRCSVCGAPTNPTGKGRPRAYCSRACQQRAYRERAGNGA